MPDTNYMSTGIIHRDPPSSVIYDLRSPSNTTITLPRGSTWSSGLHWHNTHVEYLRVVKGTIKARLGQETHIVSASEGLELKVDIGVRHEWSRADVDGEDVVVIERTEPVDDQKALFFWNLNGVILYTQGETEQKQTMLHRILKLFGLLSWWQGIEITLRLFVIFEALDNMPVFYEFGRESGIAQFSTFTRLLTILESRITYMVLGIAMVIGKVAGIKAVDERFTPPKLYTAYSKGTGVKEKKRR